MVLVYWLLTLIVNVLLQSNINAHYDELDPIYHK